MTRWLAAAALAVAAFPMAVPASADHACVGVVKGGTIGPPLSVGPVCVPTGVAHNCRFTDIALSPTVTLTLVTCLPR